MTPSSSYGDGSRDFSDFDDFLQRACGALGRLRAEQMMRGLSPSSAPGSSAPVAEQPLSEHDAAVAETLAMIDDEMRAAIDAALVAQYPALARLREQVAADAYADDDETAPYLSRIERARLRFVVWLLKRGRLSEWRVGTHTAASPDEMTPERTQGAG